MGVTGGGWGGCRGRGRWQQGGRKGVVAAASGQGRGKNGVFFTLNLKNSNFFF